MTSNCRSVRGFLQRPMHHRCIFLTDTHSCPSFFFDQVPLSLLSFPIPLHSPSFLCYPSSTPASLLTSSSVSFVPLSASSTLFYTEAYNKIDYLKLWENLRVNVFEIFPTCPKMYFWHNLKEMFKCLCKNDTYLGQDLQLVLIKFLLYNVHSLYLFVLVSVAVPKKLIKFLHHGLSCSLYSYSKLT